MSDCNLSFGGDYDGDQPTFYSSRMCKARKPHTCSECREPISIGDKYRRIVGKWDGELSTFRFCTPCVEIENEFSDGSYNYGDMWDEIETSWSYGANLTACLNRLSTVAAKELMRRQWLKFKGL